MNLNIVATCKFCQSLVPTMIDSQDHNHVGMPAVVSTQFLRTQRATRKCEFSFYSCRLQSSLPTTLVISRVIHSRMRICGERHSIDCISRSWTFFFFSFLEGSLSALGNLRQSRCGRLKVLKVFSPPIPNFSQHVSTLHLLHFFFFFFNFNSTEF